MNNYKKCLAKHRTVKAGLNPENSRRRREIAAINLRETIRANEFKKHRKPVNPWVRRWDEKVEEGLKEKANAAAAQRRAEYYKKQKLSEQAAEVAKGREVAEFNELLDLANAEIQRLNRDGNDTERLRDLTGAVKELYALPKDERIKHMNDLHILFDGIIAEDKFAALRLFKYASPGVQRQIRGQIQRDRDEYTKLVRRLGSHHSNSKNALHMAGKGMLLGLNMRRKDELEELPWIQNMYALTGFNNNDDGWGENYGGGGRRSTRKRASHKRRHTRKH